MKLWCVWEIIGTRAIAYTCISPIHGIKMGGVFVGSHPINTPHSTVLREYIAKTGVPAIALLSELD
jgi:hypothetical protein